MSLICILYNFQFLRPHTVHALNLHYENQSVIGFDTNTVVLISPQHELIILT